MKEGIRCPMKALAYIASAQASGKRLEQAINENLDRYPVEIHRSIDALRERLIDIKQSGCLVILLVTHRQELTRLLTIRSVLTDQKLILILPDRCEATVARAHMLYPRYISDAGGDFRDVAAVIRKIAANAAPN